MPFVLRLFGGFDLLGPEGEQVEAVQAHSKRAAVLTYLGVSEGPVPREELLPLLWPERSEEQARNALRITLSRLRNALSPNALGGKGEARLWLPASVVEVDVRRFDRAVADDRYREALERYRGALLEHVRLPDSVPYHRWVDETRGSYRRDAYRAAMSWAELAREREETETAEVAYRQALDLEPLKEEAAAGLIRTLAAQGKRSDALKCLESFRDRLQAELDLPPSGNLEELARRIRTEPLEKGASAAEDLPDPPESGGPEGISPRARTSRSGDSRWRSGAAGMAAVLLVVLFGAGLWYAREASRLDGGSTTRMDRPTIAVLPFTDLGTAETARPILRGLHADILTRLSNVSGLAVISRTSVSPYRASDLALSAIADSVDARWVMEGGVQVVGDQLQVNAQLIDSRSGTQLWASSYRREWTADNVFAIQTDIAQRIVGSLEAELTPPEEERLARQPTEDLEAYRLYARGRRRLDTRTEAGIRQAVGDFRSAIDRDSTFALAWAGLADAVGMIRSKDRVSYPGALPDQEFLIRQALALDSTLAEAHASLGAFHYLERNGPAALRRLRRAVELRPSYAQAHHWIGLTNLTLGRLGDALEHLGLAVELDPAHTAGRRTLIWALVADGQTDRAERQLGRLDAGRRRGMKLFVLGQLHRWGELEEVLEARLSGARDTAGIDRVKLARLAVARGDTAVARDQVRAVREEEGGHFAEGLIHAVLGEQDAAFEAWSRIEDWGASNGYAHILRYWFPEVLAPFREDPRYREVISRINEGWGLKPGGSFPDRTDAWSERMSRR